MQRSSIQKIAILLTALTLVFFISNLEATVQYVIEKYTGENGTVSKQWPKDAVKNVPSTNKRLSLDSSEINRVPILPGPDVEKNVPNAGQKLRIDSSELDKIPILPGPDVEKNAPNPGKQRFIDSSERNQKPVLPGPDVQKNVPDPGKVRQIDNSELSNTPILPGPNVEKNVPNPGKQQNVDSSELGRTPILPGPEIEKNVPDPGKQRQVDSSELNREIILPGPDIRKNVPNPGKVRNEDNTEADREMMLPDPDIEKNVVIPGKEERAPLIIGKDSSLRAEDNYEENDTRGTAWGPFSEQTWLSTIDGSGYQCDDDWFEITVTSGYTRILADCRFTHAEGDIDMLLYDNAGTILAGSGSVTDNEYIDFVVPSGGTYYIRLYYGNACNAYDLWWDDIQPPDDNYEENDACGAAAWGPFSERTWLSSVNGLGIQLDNDWYEITVSSGFERVLIDCQFTDADGDIDIELYDSDCNLIAGSYSTSDDEYIDVCAWGYGNGTTYYIRVFFGNAGNTYDLWWDDVSDPNCPPDDNYEENDTCGAAAWGPFSEGTWLSSINGPGIQLDNDWYEITVTPGYERVLVDCQFTDADGDIDIELYDSDCNLIAGSYSTSDDEYIDVCAWGYGNGTTYYIRVFFGNAGNTYDLWWDDVSDPNCRPPDDNYEENDACGAAAWGPFSEGTWLSSINGPGIQLDNDWYEITVTPGYERVLVDCQFTDANGDIDIELYDSDCNLIAGSYSTSDDEYIDVCAWGYGNGTTYYIRVFYGNAGNTYDLWWDDVSDPNCPPPDAYEPNDACGVDAYDPFPELTWLSSIGGLATQSDNDWYEITVTPEYERLLVDCQFTDADGDIDIELYDSDCNLIAGSYSTSDNEYIDVCAWGYGNGTTYYIRVFFGNAGNTYDLWWDDVSDPNCPPDDNYEPNNTCDSAWGPLPEQQWLSTIDGFGIQANDDWYEITVSSGYEQVLVDCQFTHADGDIDIALYDVSCNLITGSFSTTDNEYIDTCLSDIGGGTYYIRIFYGDAGNTYDLWWDDVECIGPDIRVQPLALTIDEGCSRSSAALNEDGTSYFAAKQLPDFEQPHLPGQLIVRFENDLPLVWTGVPGRNLRTGIEDIDKILEEYSISEVKDVFRNMDRSIYLKNTYLLALSGPRHLEQVVADFLGLPEVAYVDLNYLLPVTVVPNDPDYVSQWGLAKISAAQAWDLSQGNSGTVIAIVDTGVDWDHPDLAGNIWSNPGEVAGNGIDDDGNGYIDDIRGWDFLTGVSSPAPGEDGGTRDNNPMDFNGHGTHCSGIASAVTHNSTGIAGLGWNCKIMPVRAGYEATDGNGYVVLADAADGIVYATDNGASAINLSFGSGSGSTLPNAVQYAYSHGVVTAYAAGNDDADSPASLGNLSNNISVAATNSSDQKASFSNYGAWIDVSAPGVNVLSTLYDDTYASWGGTSMAAPHVAGLAALVYSRNSSLSAAEVTAYIKDNADNIDAENPGYVGELGTGRINAYATLQAVPVGASSFTVYNDGGSDLTVSSMSSPSWLNVTPASFTVPPGGNQVVSLSVDWASIGCSQVTDIIQIWSNDPDENPVEVTVTANPCQQFTISGRVSTSGGTGIPGVTMNGLPGPPSTDGSGYYSATVSCNWSGTVCPSLDCYSFTPQCTSYTNVDSDMPNQDYTGTLDSFVISGTVLDDVGTPLSGVTMSGLPCVPTPVTDSLGFYTCTVPCGWSGTVTPSHPVCGPFAPPSRSYSNIHQVSLNEDYSADACGVPCSYSISGNAVYYDMIKQIADVHIDLAGDSTATDFSDANGSYLFELLCAGNYTVTPSFSREDPGVSVADVVKIRRHLAVLEPFDSPYKYVACDVTCDCNCSVADIIKIRRYLAALENLPCGNWSFVDSSYPASTTDWCPMPTGTVPNYISAQLTDHDLTDSSFVGIRLGDVNNTWLPPTALAPGTKVTNGSSMAISIGKATISRDRTISIPVTLDGGELLAGTELHATFDNKSFTFQGVESKYLSDVVSSTQNARIHIVWEDINNLVEATQPMVLLTVKLVPKAGIPDEIELAIDGAEVVDETGTPYRLQISSDAATIPLEKEDVSPGDLRLSQNYPNPFNPTTTISFTLAREMDVTLTVYNLLGQKVRTLVSNRLTAGSHSITWDSRDHSGTEVSSGFYLYRLQTDDFVETKKMLLMK